MTTAAEPAVTMLGAGVPRVERLWRSQSEQPGWARPALLGITVLAAVAYTSSLSGQQPELFCAAAVRSMAHCWHDFFMAPRQ